MARQPSTAGEGSTYATSWNLTGASASGDPAVLPGAADRAIQAFGNFGGGTVIMEGSNNDADWATLHDPTGADLIFSAAGMFALMENPIYIRPRLAGATDADLTILMASRSSR
jgi:hypothetical protein